MGILGKQLMSRTLVGRNAGMLVVPMVIFVGAAISLGIFAAQVPHIDQPTTDAIKDGSNKLFLIGGLLIAGLVGLIILGKRGSVSYKW
jgi:hypothetical protein